MLDRRAFLTAAAAAAGAAALPRRTFAAAPAVSAEAWAKTVAAAKAEGEVVLYSSGIARMEEPKMKAFEAASGIKVRYARPGGGEIVIRKFETEVAAGKPLADICTLTDSALGFYAEERGWTVPVAVPNFAKLDPAYPVDRPHVAPTGSFGLVIAYNRNLLAPDKAPKAYADLARPAYKDQVLLGAPENAGSTTLLIKAWLELYGWPFVEKLRANNVAEMRLQAEAMQAVSRGEKALCVVAQSWAFTNIAQGAPINVVWPSEGTVLAEGALIVAKGGPHPNAALLLANHLLSAESQGPLTKVTGSFASAAGVPSPPGFPKLSELKVYRPNLAELGKMRGELIERWRKIMS